MSRLLVILLSCCLAACSASDNEDLDASGADAKGASDTLPDDQWKYVEAAPQPVALSCNPVETAFDDEECARASVLIDGSKTPAGCEPHAGAQRSTQPIVTFERQDDACAGWEVIEVLFYATTNSAARFTSTTHGFIPKDDDGQVRELPQGVLVAVGVTTTEKPSRNYELSVRLTGAKLIVSKVTSAN